MNLTCVCLGRGGERGGKSKGMGKWRGSPLSQEVGRVIIPACRIKPQVGGHGLVLCIKFLPTHLRGVDLHIKVTLTLLEPSENQLVVICALWRPGARAGGQVWEWAVGG